MFAIAVAPKGGVCSQQPLPSLGEIAREWRQEHANEKKESVPVFTNDNLPARSIPREESSKTPEAERAAEPSKGQSKLSQRPVVEKGEKYFRSKAEAIRSKLEFHQRQLAVLEQQLGLTRTEFYSDPQKTLEEESTPAFHSDVNKLRAKIEETQQQIAADQRAMDDLRDELRRKGGDPGWIRE